MDFRRVISYLKQSSASSGDEEVKQWLTDPENEAQAREMLGMVWTENQISLKKRTPDYNKMLGSIHHRINMSRQGKTIHPQRNQTRGRSIPLFYRVAAVLALPLLITSVILLVLNYKSATDATRYAERELITRPGTRVKIQLEDGTTVWLNDGTRIRYPEKFAKNERHVFVDGEAYFDVESDPDRPFVVENPMINTIVTGTSFNLRAYSNDHYFEATLSRGVIRLEKDGRQIVMKPGEQIRYNQGDSRFLSRMVDPAIYSSWIEGKLIMKDEPFPVAMLKLSRWYNADFIIQEKELSDFLLTATLENEKIEQTLEHMSYALPVRYRIEKKIESGQTKTIVYMMKK